MPESGNVFVPVNGSERAVLPGARVSSEVDPNEVIEITIRVRPRQPIDDEKVALYGTTPPDQREYMSYEQFLEEYGADPADLKRVSRFATDAGLTVLAADAAKRTVIVHGKAGIMRQALGGVSLKIFTNDLVTYRGRVGPLMMPPEIADVVEGVFGLDNRPQAKPHFVVAPQNVVRARAIAQSYLTRDVGKLYNFPADATGAGECIAILEFGGGFTQSDLHAYFSQTGVAAPRVTSVPVDGAGNAPGDPADVEVLLDIEVAGSIAPGASVVVYFAPFTERGWVDSLLAAVHDRVNKPSVISISWGWAEGFDLWTRQALNAVDDVLKQAVLLGITVCVASGDDGSADDQTDSRVHVDFPASSPFVLACGGTTLFGSGAVISSETTWNSGPRAQGFGASGGGVSAMIPLQSWQANANVPRSLATGKSGRGVPDVSGNADGATGYRIFVNGSWETVGGTSAVAPLWAGLVALLNQKLGKRAGFMNPFLYANGAAFRDILTGSNDTTGRYGGYKARRGWDACTGLGSPNGAALLSRLQGNHAAVTPSGQGAPTLGWQPIPGYAIDIAVVGQGTLFAVGGDYAVYRWNGLTWLPIGGSAVRITAEPDGTPWVIGVDGRVYRQTGATWEPRGGPAVDISAGRDGSIWAAGADGSLLRLDGDSWTSVAAGVSRVSALDASHVEVVSRGTIAHWDGNALTEGNAAAADVAAGPIAWAATPGGLAYNGADGTWDVVSPIVYAGAVAADDSGLPWIITLSGLIYAATRQEAS
jgi:kumamolisin